MNVIDLFVLDSSCYRAVQLPRLLFLVPEQIIVKLFYLFTFIHQTGK